MNPKMKTKTVEATTGVIPKRLVGIVSLNDIPGAEYSKRALEVALTGDHCIVLLYSNGSKAADLIQVAMRIAVENGWAFKGLAYPVCPCGNFGHLYEECRCRPSAIERHLSKLAKRVAEFGIWVDAPADRPTPYRAEPEADFIGRVKRGRAFSAPSADLDASCQELVASYIHTLSNGLDIQKVKAIAQTIARLDRQNRILVQHVAEALQYQPHVLPGFRDLIRPTQVEVKT